MRKIVHKINQNKQVKVKASVRAKPKELNGAKTCVALAELVQPGGVPRVTED